MSTFETRLAQLERARRDGCSPHVRFALVSASAPRGDAAAERCSCGRPIRVLEFVDPFSHPPVYPPYQCGTPQITSLQPREELTVRDQVAEVSLEHGATLEILRALPPIDAPRARYVADVLARCAVPSTSEGA